MAYVAKKCSLGAIKVGQLFSSLFFRFIRFSIGDAGRNLAGGQIEKASIARIKLAAGVQRCDENASRLLLPAPEDPGSGGPEPGG